jgi:hypothetical protein
MAPMQRKPWSKVRDSSVTVVYRRRPKVGPRVPRNYLAAGYSNINVSVWGRFGAGKPFIDGRVDVVQP